MKKILTIISILLLPGIVFAQEQFNSIGQILVAIIELLLGLGGVVALIGIIISGYRYITSLGNPEAVGGAKNGLLYSIIGLVVILLSVVFVRFLFNQLGVTDLDIFGL